MNDEKYELPISLGYVESWGTREAIREILQNGKDFVINCIELDDKNDDNEEAEKSQEYSIKVSDIVLNSNSSDVITIKVDEDNKNIIIDYTNLFKIDNNNLTKEVVSIKYSNINNINSLEK